MLTVQQHVFPPDRSWVTVALPDGWRPLEVFWRDTQHSGFGIYLAALVDTSAKLEREVLHFLKPGDDLDAISEREGCDLAYLGRAGSTYVFLEVRDDGPRHFDGRKAPEKLPKLPPLSR